MHRALERRGDGYPLLDLGGSPNTTMTQAANAGLSVSSGQRIAPYRGIVR